jgi:hypothetical protein
MATAASTLVQRVRRYVGDWPDLDVTTASLSNSVTTVSVADTTIYGPNWLIQLDQEILRVKALTNATTLTVARGMQGTTAATHVTASSVLIRPAWSDIQILDALNAGVNATFPFYYQPVQDTSLLPNGTTYEFAVPNLVSPAATPIPYITDIQLKVSGDTAYRTVDGRWTILRGSAPIIKFRSPPATGTLRVYGFGPFAQLAYTDNLPTLWPVWGDDPLVEYAAQRLLMSGEAGRVRVSGPRDDREAATRVGSSAQVAGQLLQRFQMRMAQQPMPPLPRHATRTFF